MVDSGQAPLGPSRALLPWLGYHGTMPKAKHKPTAKALLSRPEWRRLADQVQLEPPEAPKPRFQPWRGKGKGVSLDAVLEDLRR
jgi:hypothetical protein